MGSIYRTPLTFDAETAVCSVVHILD